MMRSPRFVWLIEYSLMVAILGMIVGMACALSVAFDVHSTRVEFAAANADWRRETFRRLDSLLWKTDTGLEIASAARLDFGNLLTKLAVQVRQSAESSASVSKSQTQAATKVVTQAIDTTRQAIQAVSGEPSRPPEDGPAAADRSPVTVNVPPPTVISEKPPDAPHVQVTERPRKRRRWFSFLWPGNWRPE